MTVYLDLSDSEDYLNVASKLLGLFWWTFTGLISFLYLYRLVILFLAKFSLSWILASLVLIEFVLISIVYLDGCLRVAVLKMLRNELEQVLLRKLLSNNLPGDPDIEFLSRVWLSISLKIYPASSWLSLFLSLLNINIFSHKITKINI